MERAYVDQGRGHQNSLDPRPRATTGGRGSTTNGHKITIPPALAPDLEPTPTRTNTTPVPSKSASAYISTLSSSQTSTSPSCSSSTTSVFQPQAQLPSVSCLSSEKCSNIPSHSQPASALQAHLSTAYSRHPPPSTILKSSTSQPAIMSTAALHFDPGFNHFNMGGRSSFAWPDVVLEPAHNTHYGQDLGPYSSEASLSPPTHSRSITNSPPRMTPEQRELKRQRDQARRDSKLAARLHRSSSHSSQSGHYEVASPPHSINGDYTSTTGLSHMPIYTTAPADISLLTEPTTLAPQLVLPPYSPPLPSSNSLPLHSPPLPSSTSTVFPSPYQPHSYLPEYPYTPSTSSSVSSHYGHISQEPPMMYSMPPVMHNTGMSHQGDNNPSAVRIVQSRPKPQCWEHGCNGRQFSTFSNLLRHQREKSGQASKASCPDCGAEFTRTTARNGHLLHQKCKTKRQGSTSSN